VQQQVEIKVEGQKVSGVWTQPEAAAKEWIFVYAPGAGANLNDGFGVFAGRGLAQAGIASLRFQLPYMEAGRRAPDRPPLLAATWRAAIETARGLRAGRLVAGGRSMGGRVASLVVAGGAAVEALALFAYPLHAPGRPEKRRDDHLDRVAVPTLFCSGDRDAFASVAELGEAAALPAQASVHVLAGADHGFNVRKSSGSTREDVWLEALDALLRFLGAV
jgi:predicted alpha/beta-hydrolase family hydrolase